MTDRATTTADTRRTSTWPAVAAYFVLAWLLSWCWLALVAATGEHIVAGRGWPTHFPALLGPALAALIVTAWTCRAAGVTAFARRLVRVRAHWWCWLVALSPILLVPIVLAVLTILGGDMPAPADFAVISGIPSTWGLLGVAAAVLLVNGFGEEAGWRGYAQPAVQTRLRPLAATAIVALGWAVWHVPMFFLVASFRGFDVVILIGWSIGLFSGAVVLTWLYNRSGGSILLVAIWHAGYTLASGTKAAEDVLAATITTMVIATAVALVALELRAIRRRTPSVLG